MGYAPANLTVHAVLSQHGGQREQDDHALWNEFVKLVTAIAKLSHWQAIHLWVEATESDVERS